MKQLCACLLIFALCLSVLPLVVSAKTFELSDLTYTIENGEVTITDCNWKTGGFVQIPDNIEGYPVTVIGKNAFTHCYEITEVVVPEGVHTIEGGAFANISWLKKLTIPNSILWIGENVVKGCSQLNYNEYDNGKYLGNEENPYHLLVAPKNLNITECVLHPDTKVIGYGAFQNCASLTSVDIPDNVVTVGVMAFYQCDALTSVVIGEGVTEIGNSAFMGCDWLSDVTMGGNVTRIGSSAFYGCRLSYNEYGLGKYLGNEKNPYYALMANGLYYAENSITVHPRTRIISDRAFYNTNTLVNITISGGVEIIEANAFASCLYLTEITIPDNVIELRNGVFKGCKNLEKVYFSGDAPSFGDEIFKNVVATVYYHPGTNGWTEETMQNYGGELTWVESHFFENGFCSICGESETGELPVYTTISGDLQSFGERGAVVELYINGEMTPIAVLEANDRYVIESVLPGEYVLVVSKENHVTRSYPVTMTEEATVLDLKIQPIGDVNGDGSKNMGDVSMIYAHVRKTALLADEYLLLCADLTGEGQINMGDIAECYASIKYNK